MTAISYSSPDQIAGYAVDVLDDILPDKPVCALIDFPDHPNVGDSAIWLGERIYLERKRADVRYVCSSDTFSERTLRALMPEGIILIHGGGNFGTIWERHQALRDTVLRRLRDYPVIQLPQSLYFDNRKALARSADIVARHPDFTLLVRDSASLEIARSGLGIEATLCPDSAFFLHGRFGAEAPVVECYGLCRTDKELHFRELPKALRKVTSSIEVEDWLKEPWNLNSFKARARSILPRLGLLRRPETMRDILRLWDEAAMERVQRGCSQLSRGRVVVTDRLHAQILCIILGIPSISLDNTYMKIAHCYDDWLSGIPICRMVNRTEELPAALSDISAIARGH